MKNPALSISFFFVLIFQADFIFACTDEKSARVVALKGSVVINSSNGSSKPQIAHLNQNICEDSKVQVMPNSLITLALPGDLYIDLAEKTEILLKKLNLDVTTIIKVYHGFLNFISRKPKDVQIENGITNAMPVGTEFAFNADDTNASVWVYEGKVKVYNPHGSLILKPGNAYARVQKGRAPALQIDIKPEDAVNWALYYPPLMPYPAKTDPIDSALKTAIEDYRHGRVDLALNRLDSLPPAQQTPYFYQIRAAIRLAVGQVKPAEEDIQELLKQNVNDAEGLALKSVIALTQNCKDEALKLAQQAVNGNPQSATAFSALSYAEQGRFDLDKAYKAAIMASKLVPQDALVWARQAELELSQGLIDESENSAKRAYQLDPTLERTQTIRGFAFLQQMEADDAQNAFTQALERDSSSPLARLGLGLAKIRQGELEEGRKDIEIAAILDPNNSLIRSYLGKAYYEERRPAQADEQFKLAKERDSKDPTPLFYDALNKLTTNRPVEALQDIQKANDLNNNRGVYRSSLSLDKDLAARSAAQGRIYNELNFQQQGLLEGWKAVNKDPNAYSAHRLLADNYAALPRHELARVSELLQSQLLQPVNITPIQPNLAESNIFVLNNLGPSELSYNEFNPLFEYNRFALQASGFYGGNNSWGDNVALSGLQDRASFSLGQFHYQTDGFRDNNFYKKDLYNAFVQSQITEDLNLQAEYRHEDRSNGDLALNFNKNIYDNSFMEKRNVDSYRIGGRYLFSQNSSFLGSLIYQDVHINQNIVEDDAPSQTSIFRNGFIMELQHIYENSWFSMINGFGHINQNSKIFSSDEPGHAIDSSPIKTNFYNYSKFNITKNLRASIGLSFDFFKKGNNPERNFINPKFGLEWLPTSKTTIRGAAFRGMSVNQTSSQTIEPTQVSGFNQLFDDINGTLAWRYGIGVDHRFSKYLASGLEYSERKLDKISGDRSEQLGRAYIHITPSEQLSISSEYFYERINKRGNFSPDSPYSLAETHRFPLTLGFFHSSGLSFKIKNSFVHQSGLFLPCLKCSETKSGNSNFFIVDINFNYRLPKRYGILNFGINNLLDKSFNYQSTNLDSNEVILSPSRLIYSRFTLSF